MKKLRRAKQVCPLDSKRISGKKLRSKGERLNWPFLKDEKMVDLRDLNFKGEDVIIPKDNTPLLIP